MNKENRRRIGHARGHGRERQKLSFYGRVCYIPYLLISLRFSFSLSYPSPCPRACPVPLPLTH